MEKDCLLPYVRYLWWMTPEKALDNPLRLIAQIMDIGGFEDAMRMRRILGDEPLREALRRAQPGWLNIRSWHYWHYMLDMAEPDQVPPLPVRRIENAL